MASHKKVWNVTRLCYADLSQARTRVTAGVCAWIDPENYTAGFRELTLLEMRDIRKSRASFDGPLASSELPGVVVEWPTRLKAEVRSRYHLILEARQFVEAGA